VSSPVAEHLHVRTARVTGLAEPLELLRRLGSRTGLFLRLARGPGPGAQGWSYLALAQGAPLSRTRLGQASRLADVLAPLRPLPVVRRGPPIPFAAGWVGYLGYEARSGIEHTPPPRPSPFGFPALWLARTPAVLAWEPRTGRAFVGSVGRDARTARAAAERLLAIVQGLRRRAGRKRTAARTHDPIAGLEPGAYARAVERVRQHVLAGDLFQANLSQRFDARTSEDPVALFERLVERQPAPFLTFLTLPGGRAVLSASPERFLSVHAGRARTEPMKGTRPRGATAAADRALRAELDASEKDRAELAMIVDLSRNDLARVCTPGTVRVRAARRLIPFARVFQAIGVVEGRLGPGRDRVDLLQAAFPPGSVTGAPKVRAMEVIDALEGEGRGPYCGALGWFDVGGDMDLAVAIRTLLVSRGLASYRVGGGITLRSDPVEEWRETLTKGRGLFAALAGREDGRATAAIGAGAGP
jgi:para-aminobenzoate synthetase component 1